MRHRKSTPYTESLRLLDLNESEVAVYTYLVEHGNTTAKDLAARLPLPRTLTYHVLQGLEGTGLVTRATSGGGAWRTVYCPENPKVLYELLAAKEKQFVASKNALYEAVPKLMRDFAHHGNVPTVRLLKDVASYAAVLSEGLDTCTDAILSYEDPTRAYAAADIRERFERRRIAKKIYKKILCEDSQVLRAFLKERAHDEYTEFRILPGGATVRVESLVLFTAHAHSVRAGTHEPCVVYIEDTGFVGMQRSLFGYLWEHATPVTLAHIHV